jgi:hypothetical protein
LELSGTERHARGLGPSKQDYLLIRERWAQISNEALRDAGVAERIDHRSLKKQGIDREPVAAIPQKVYYAERKSGLQTEAGDAIRARHRERVEARRKGHDELARVLQQQKEDDRRRTIDGVDQKNAHPGNTPRSMLTREELNQRRRERYHTNAQALNQRRRDYRSAHAADAAAKRWSKLREKELKTAGASPESASTGQEAAWLGEPSSIASADDAARNWEAFRDRQQAADPSRADLRGRAHESGSGGSGNDADDDNDDERDSGRRRDYDIGL